MERPIVSHMRRNQVLEEVISPACIAYGLDAVRADMITRSGEIPEQISVSFATVPS